MSYLQIHCVTDIFIQFAPNCFVFFSLKKGNFKLFFLKKKNFINNFGNNGKGIFFFYLCAMDLSQSEEYKCEISISLLLDNCNYKDKVWFAVGRTFSLPECCVKC